MNETSAIAILIAAIFTSNILLSNFLGMCSLSDLFSCGCYWGAGRGVGFVKHGFTDESASMACALQRPLIRMNYTAIFRLLLLLQHSLRDL